MPKAAAYNQRIAVKSVTTTKSATGAEIPGSPVLFLNAWAQIERRDDGVEAEPFASGKQYAQAHYIVRLRYRSGILPTMQVHYAGRVLDILAVDHRLERRRELELTCREIATSATP